jgi:ribonuclease R
MEAERDIVELKKLQFMQGKIGEQFNGYIAGVTGFGCFVELTEVFVEGLVHLSTLTDDQYTFEERMHSLAGRRTGRILRIGDPVTVRVVAVNPQARRIEFVLVTHAPAQRPETAQKIESVGEYYPKVPIRGKRLPIGSKPVMSNDRQGRDKGKRRR